MRLAAGKAGLYTRNGNDWMAKLCALAKEFGRLGVARDHLSFGTADPWADYWTTKQPLPRWPGKPSRRRASVQLLHQLFLALGHLLA